MSLITDNFVLGTDVSFYENFENGKIDFVKMKSSGVRFTIIRTGQNVWVDSCFRQNWSDARLAGLWRGSYWFYDSRISPQEQANLWIETMNGDFGELPLFADFEDSYNGKYGGGENLKIFIEAVKKLAPNKEIMIYTAFYYWKDNVPSSMYSYFQNFGLWIANYGVAQPSVPNPFKNWDFWQYSEDGSGKIYGCNGNVDMNYFNGNIDDFTRRFNLKPVNSEPLPKDQMIFEKEYYDGIVYRKYETFLEPQGKTTYHVIMVDTSKVDFYVTPQVNSRMYVPDFLDKFGLTVAINGDGFVSTKIGGFASSDGKSYGQLGAEGTVFISKENVFSKSVQKPIWTAISYPNDLVRDGKIVKINKSLDDIRGRSAFGYTKDQKTLYIIAVDGKDYYSKIGMNFPEVAQLFVNFGCDTANMLDGGGSTTLSINDKGTTKILNVPCGEDYVQKYDLSLRRVANCFAIKTRTDFIPTPTGNIIKDTYNNVKRVIGKKKKRED